MNLQFLLFVLRDIPHVISAAAAAAAAAAATAVAAAAAASVTYVTCCPPPLSCRQRPLKTATSDEKHRPHVPESESPPLPWQPSNRRGRRKFENTSF